MHPFLPSAPEVQEDEIQPNLSIKEREPVLAHALGKGCVSLPPQKG